MNTSTKNASRDHAGEEQIPMGRKAPLSLAAGLAVAALFLGAVAVWQVTTGGAADRPVELPSRAGAVDPIPADAALPENSDPGADPAAVAVELERRVADIDGDGRQDVVQLQAVGLSGVADQITISWGTEGSEVHALTGGGEGRLLPLRDLDGDGDLEIVVHAGGGEASWHDVFTFTGTRVVKARAEGSAGTGVASISRYQNEGWTTTYLADGFVDYRFVDPSSAQAPAAIELRDWVLAGTDLTPSAQVIQGCWVQQGGGFAPSRDAC